MNRKGARWTAVLGGSLVGSAVVLYVIHYLIFRDAHHIFIFMLHDLAFLPIEVLLVGLVIERILARRERRLVMEKLNVVIGTFFGELGLDLVKRLTRCVANMEEALPVIQVRGGWKESDYARAVEFARSFRFRIDPACVDLPSLTRKLSENRNLLVLLMANPNLLEHEEFTSLLWSIFHLLDELSPRDSLEEIPPRDLNHIASDIRRVYRKLIVEWLRYCRHLQQVYPYMFGYLLRSHPLGGGGLRPVDFVTRG